MGVGIAEGAKFVFPSGLLSEIRGIMELWLELGMKSMTAVRELEE